MHIRKFTFDHDTAETRNARLFFVFTRSTLNDMGFLSAKCLLAMIAVAAASPQYEEYQGFEGLYENYPKAALPYIHHQSLGEHHGEEYDTDFHAHPKYAFDYSVKDPHTGDDKEHWETRDGDKVKGSYTLIETDGTKRVVEYEADDKNGFNAVVHKIGTPVEHPAQHYHAVKKPHYEAPLQFHNGYDDGFVPIVGGYEH